MWPAHYVVAFLVPLALWILVSGLDDLFISVVYLLIRRKPFPWPSDSELCSLPERRIAILIPLWHEHAVIGQMLEHNLAAIRYSAYHMFVGVYPNDDATVQAVRQVATVDPRVHLVIGPHDGPTSKGDCLNWIYRRMGEYEALHGPRFEVVMTHDAEDLVDAQSLRLVNWFSREYAMVQVPVLPLPTPLREIVHGLYCDEFAEFQSKDIPVRHRLGGFLPANGVGTGFERAALDHLADTRRGLIFDPECLTEDYENGYRLHALGYRQIFLPVRLRNGSPMATREYFPRNFRSATRQRSRWVAGIALQGWQNHGWRESLRQIYWFWRDRKGLVGNLLAPVANMTFLAGLAGYRHPLARLPEWLVLICYVTCAIALVQMVIRAFCCAQIYGWRFASAVPLRASWGNVINCYATVAAVRQFATARLQRRSMSWRKTEHVYPRERLGEVLVRLRVLSAHVVEKAAREVPKGMRLGEHLMQSHQLSEESLYQALSLQSEIPFVVELSGIDRSATRSIPVEAARRLQVLPFRVETGNLHVATTEIPSVELRGELSRLSALKIHYRLVSPRRFGELARRYLPESGGL